MKEKNVKFDWREYYTEYKFYLIVRNSLLD